MTAASVAPHSPRRMDPRSRTLAAAFASPQLPAALQPHMNDRNFQVALLWQGDQLVDVARVEASGKTGPKELPLAAEMLPRTLLPRAQALPGGDVALLLPTETAVQILRGETTVTPAELFAARDAEPIEVPFRGLRYVVKLEERVVVTSGALQLVGRYMRPERVVRRPLEDRIDPLFLSMITIGCIVLAFVLGIFRLALAAGIELDEGPLTKRPGITAHSAPPMPVVLKPVELGGGISGTAGSHDKPPKEGGLNHGKPSNKPLGSPVASLLAALEGVSANNSVFGDSGNTSLDIALRGLKPGSQVAANGMEGLGPRGDGPGAGKEFGVARIGSPDGVRGGIPGGISIKGHEKTNFPPPTRMEIEGGLPKDVVGRIIKRHWNEVRYCYERELNKDPNLAGKVAMHFQIGPLGDVTLAEVSETSLNNATVEQCIASNVRRWVFPQPKGGGLVEVNYPFILETTNH